MTTTVQRKKTELRWERDCPCLPHFIFQPSLSRSSSAAASMLRDKLPGNANAVFIPRSTNTACQNGQRQERNQPGLDIPGSQSCKDHFASEHPMESRCGHPASCVVARCWGERNAKLIPSPSFISWTTTALARYSGVQSCSKLRGLMPHISCKPNQIIL